MSIEPHQKIEVVHLNRDCVALMVPQGAQILLREGTEVKIMQDKGNSFTVDVYGNLARIEAKDADAIGKMVHDPLDDLSADASLEDKVKALLDTVYDPEIPVSIVALGLVYRIDMIPIAQQEDHYRVEIEMTLTAPGCGMGPVIAEDAKQKLLSISEVDEVQVEIVFDPPWDRSMMSDEAKLELGLF